MSTPPSMRTVATAARGFPRSARLLLPAQFKACFDSGQRLSGRFFRIHVAPSVDVRLGLAVSRKVSPRAVVRNRIKRAARESFRQHRLRLPGWDIVLLARREAADADPAALRSDLAAVWRRIAALKRPDPHGTMRADLPGDAPAAPLPAPERTASSRPAADPSPPGDPRPATHNHGLPE